MKRTLLDIVQGLLSDLDGDEVNSINDTVEATQLARTVQQTFYNIVTKIDSRELERPFSLEADGGPTKPTLMSRPVSVDNIKWIKYDKRLSGETVPNFQDVYYVTQEEFFSKTLNIPEETGDTYGSFEYTLNGFPIQYYYNSTKAPTFYTTVDDTHVVFDSFDSEVEANLQKSKVLGFGRVLPSFSLTDSFVPDLDSNMFPLLYQEAKAQAFVDFKQVDNKRTEREARSQWTQANRRGKNIGNSGWSYGGANDKLPNFGRRT